jgi:F-type H+-transporting ATPase subunit b
VLDAVLDHVQTAEFWVAAAFAIFVAFLAYIGAHRKVFDALDRRSARIKAELDEARRLREEAEKILAEYQRRQREADREAAEIIAGAKAEAERLAAEARARLEDYVLRRTKMAETKIAQAEAQAVADVRAAAADAAVAAAEKVLAETVKDKVADELIARGIAEAAGKLKVN